MRERVCLLLRNHSLDHRVDLCKAHQLLHAAELLLEPPKPARHLIRVRDQGSGSGLWIGVRG